MRCEHDGLKFGRGQEPCLNPDTRQHGAGPWGAIWLCPDHKYHADDICAEARAAEREHGAGPWGAIWLCPDHKYHADDICAEARAAEREHGAALAQLARDERAMLRGR